MHQYGRHVGGWALIGLLFGAPGAFADDVAGQITASTGLIQGGEQGSLVEGEHVNLGEDGGCSILVDEDSVVELCGDTSLVLRKEKKRRVVSLDRGEIRLVVEPREFDKRVEIHTPAAIATLLGTIVHVSVDENGVTTISSAESKISVRSSDPTVRGTTVINTSEQVSLAPGEAPPATPRRLKPTQVAALGGCLVDFHSAAIGRDVAAHAIEVTDRLAALDAAAFGNAPAALRQRPTGMSAPGEATGSDPIAAQEGVCTATECAGENLSDFDQGRGGQSMYGGQTSPSF